MRIYSYLKNNLNLTKSEVMRLDSEGRILVNGKKENLSRNIRSGEVVTCDGIEVKNIEFSYYVYNKPKGVICTNNKNIKDNIASKLDIDKKVYPVGRLDKDTRGLIFLTNDNKFTHYVLESKEVDKEYLVTVEEEITDSILESLQDVITIGGKKTTRATVKKESSSIVSITLFEGRYHQVRELVKHSGAHLVDLKRIRIGKYILDNDLEEGKYKEVHNLKDLL